MRVAILHHHLNRGGVSQVIANHLRSHATLPVAERPQGEVVLLFDGQQDGWPEDPFAGGDALPLALVTESAIGYDRPGTKADAEGLATALRTALAGQGMSPADTLLHVHNHALGKNASLPGALQLLARDGWKLLLQVHDFAEDNRPTNYQHLSEALRTDSPESLGKQLYPCAEHIHYVTLTQRDASLLRGAGVPDERVHTLPNPAALFGTMPSRDEARERVLPALELAPSTRLWTYPVRGIRRKNLGEMLLLAALAPRGHAFAVTLAPKNPAEGASFERWQALSERLGLPCRFDTGGVAGVVFQDVLAASDALLTTSVAEGFGMVFLEAWLAGRPLVGRDLPEITQEFRDHGMRFSQLYKELNVPVGLLDKRKVINGIDATYRAVCGAYGITPLSTEWNSLLADGIVDFSRLPTASQAKLIENLAGNPEAQRVVLDANHELQVSLHTNPKSMAEEIASNSKVVRQVYSEQNLGKYLGGIYQSLWESEVGPLDAQPVDGGAILNHFVTPERVLPVRIEP